MEIKLGSKKKQGDASVRVARVDKSQLSLKSQEAMSAVGNGNGGRMPRIDARMARLVQMTGKELDYIGRAYDIAYSHGFHEKECSMEHLLMLVISEVGEIIDADRRGRRANLGMFGKESESAQPVDKVDTHWKFCFEEFVKDTVEDELADVCIRLFDFCGEYHFTPCFEVTFDFPWDFKGQTMAENAYYLCTLLCESHDESLSDWIGFCLFYVYSWAIALDIDLRRHIELKMRYNDMRGKYNGKRY